MSTRDINNRISIISSSDTLTDFMNKCNDNFNALVEMGGGMKGADGEKGSPGSPTKPKVPIHVWRKGIEYDDEPSTADGGFEITNIHEDLENEKYQSGHLILLQNGHVYILEPMAIDGFDLEPKFILALQSYDPQAIIDGKSAYMHIAYADNVYGDNMVTDQQLRNENTETEPIATFGLRRNSVATASLDISEKPYMGIYSDFEETSSTQAHRYTWVRIQGQVGSVGEMGPQGVQGPQGPKGDDGDAFTGQQYTIDLEGDMSTISLDVDRTRLYDESGDYCKCTLHAYYGSESVELNTDDVIVGLPDEFIEINSVIVLKTDHSKKVGKIVKEDYGKNVIIKFTPDDTFVFPQKYITFPISVSTTIYDTADKKTYNFYRETKWSIKGMVSPFKLEIIPQYRVIKLDKNGYIPNTLNVFVYKIEDGKREIFDFSKYTDFEFQYKNINTDRWNPYPSDGVPTYGVSCLEFRVVRYVDSEGSDLESVEEIWDYEDVWVVADGKDTHYYHGDLGNTESMMVLTTGNKINYGSDAKPIYCADLKNKDGYSITFNPKFYDGSNEITNITSVSVSCENVFGESFKYNFVNNTFTITRVPYGIEIIPMTFSISAEDDGVTKFDTVSFNVYISTSSDLYTLEPSVSAYNTSNGRSGDTIVCSVYKNNNLIQELDAFALTLQYVIHNESGNKNEGNYVTPLKYCTNFTASDVAIDFILSYRGDEVVRSTVPLIKDGIDGKDGDSWQYIFCRSSEWPFSLTGISDPSLWKNDPNPNNSDSDYLGDKESDYPKENSENLRWYDDHKGVDNTYKYEYQSYRKWDKNNKEWGNYLPPTLYSNYSESGSGYSIMLSNPVAVIPVGDDDWSVNENNSNQSDSTLVYLYNNTSDMSKFDSVTISIPDEYKSHFSTGKDGNINKVTFKPIADNGTPFNFQSNAQFKLPITVTYANGDGDFDDFISTINWTLTPIKGLEDVEVFVDKRVVNTTIAKNHSFRVGYYLTSSNSDRTFIDDRIDGNTKGYDIILTDDIDKLNSEKIVEDWTNAKFDFEYNNNGSNKNCYVVLVKKLENESGTTFNIIDYINIESVNNGIDGKSEIHLELSQDYISLPCNNYGKVHESYTEDVSFKMTLYNGDTPIENNSITYYFKIGNEYITSDVGINENKFTIPKDKINGNTNIECIATYKSIPYTKTLYIELSETPYELEFNKNTLTRDLNIGVNGEIIDEFLIVSVKYWDSTKGMWVYTNDGKLKITVPNDTITINDSDFNKLNDSKCKRQLAIPDALRKNTKDTELRVSYYVNDGDEISYELIGIINRAKNGVDGKSSIHLELLQDYIALPCDNNGNIHFSYGDNTPISSRMILYNGDTPIESEYISHYIKPKNGSVTTPVSTTDGTFVIPRDMIDGDTYIECIATYNGVSYQKTLFIDLEETPYELELNKNIFTRTADGNIIDANLTVCVKYWDSTKGVWEYTQTGDVKIKYKKIVGGNYVDAEHIFNISKNDTTDFIRTLSDNDKTSIIWSYATEFRISYSINGQEASYENIGVVSNGERGETASPPTCEKAEIIGYSLSELSVDSNEWKDSLNELGKIETGVTIYMLNKYTWSVGEPTLFVTTTLSGTQGVDGKSRVLFYLGSFKDGTLKGEDVMGHLTDERCDYYIDADDKAWMRIGVEDRDINNQGIPGSPNGLSNSKEYWVESSKVGFLQAGAIHADMINVGSISAATGFLDELRALDVNATIIKGHTIQSDENFKYNGVDTPTWQINNGGDGWLANKNIEWDENGDLTINGKINGSIGNSENNVIINGDLIINNTITEGGISISKPSLILCANQDYDNSNKITLTSGFSDTLYAWECKSPIDNSGNNNIHNTLYTKEDYSGVYEGTSVRDLFYFNGQKYIKYRGYTNAYTNTNYTINTSNNDTTTYEFSETVIYIEIDGILYEYGYNDDYNVDIRDNLTHKINTANTNILSDGTILTNSILATDGIYYGSIYSDGIFSGSLNDASGSITNTSIVYSTIYHSDITLKNNDFIASYSTSDSSVNFFNLMPNLNINGADVVKTIKSQYFEKTDTSIGSKDISKTFHLGTLKVYKNTIITINAINFKITGYQPNKGEGYRTAPKLDIYWKYVNKSNKNYICSFYYDAIFDTGNLEKIGTDYNGKKWIWGPDYSKEENWKDNNGGIKTSRKYTASEDGEIEIIASFKARSTGKDQIFSIDKPNITCRIYDFDVLTSSTYTPDNNSIVFTQSGMIIKSPDGSTLKTTEDNGCIKIMSPNGSYGLKVTDNGIMYYKSSEGWKSLKQ
jgi:hypothetical protein